MVGWMNLGVAAGRISLDVLSAGAGLSRGVMFGSYALYEDVMRDVERQTNVYEPSETEVVFNVNMNERRLALTSAFAGCLTTTAYFWVLKKMVLRDRAQFIASMGKRLNGLLKAMIEGTPNTAIKWADSYGGLTKIRANALNLQRAIEEGVDLTTISLDLRAFNRESLAVERLYREFNDTFVTLQYANTLGGGGLYIDPATGLLAGHPDAVLTLDEVTRLQKISNSQTIFGRVQYVDQRGVKKAISGSSVFRPFANKDIAMLAEMFIPDKNVADDLFNLADELKGFSVFIDELKTELDVVRNSVRNSLTTIDNIISNDPLGTDLQARATARRVAGIQSQQIIDATAGVGDEIQRIQRIETEFAAKVATAEKVSDGIFVRFGGWVAEKAAYATIRTASGLLISKEVAETWAQKVGRGAKIGGRFLGKVFFIDTIVWATTGVFDLLFVDDDAEYDNAVMQYLADNWGFTPIGFLVDKAVDALLSEEAQDVALQNLRATIATALLSDQLSGVVQTLVDFYQVEFEMQIFPADFFFTSGETSVAVSDYIIGFNPLDILSVALVACVAKIVFNAWVRPAAVALIGQAGV